MTVAINARRRSGFGTDASDSETPPLTVAQLQELEKELEERRASLLVSLEKGREQERESGREVGDEMDEANMEEEAAVASKLLERDAQLLAEIERALARIREGTYGICEGTGEPIGYSRLRLRPWARYSVEYQEELERQIRTNGRA